MKKNMYYAFARLHVCKQIKEKRVTTHMNALVDFLLQAGLEK